MEQPISFAAIDQVDPAIVSSSTHPLATVLIRRLTHQIIPVVGTPNPIFPLLTVNDQIAQNPGFRFWPAPHFPDFPASAFFIFDLLNVQLHPHPLTALEQQQLSTYFQRYLDYLQQHPHIPTTIIQSSRYTAMPVHQDNHQYYQWLQSTLISQANHQIANFRTVFIDDFLPTSYLDLIPSYPLHDFLSQYHQGSVHLPHKGVYRLYPLTCLEAIEGIFKATFATGTRGSTFAIIGQHPVTALSLVKQLDRYSRRSTLQKLNSSSPPPVPNLVMAEASHHQLQLASQTSLTQIIQTLAENLNSPTTNQSVSASYVNHVKYNAHYRPNRTRKFTRRLLRLSLRQTRRTWQLLQNSILPTSINWRYAFTSIVLLVAFLALPLLMYIISAAQTGISTYRSFHYMQQGDFFAAVNQAEFANQQFYQLQKTSYLTLYLDKLPGASHIRQSISPHFTWMHDAAQAAKHASLAAISIQTLAKQLAANQTGSQESRLIIANAELQLQRTHQDLTQLQLHLPEQLPHLFTYVISAEDFHNYRQQLPKFLTYLKTAEQSLAVAPHLIGSNGPRQIAILFQNNRELRPTGGFIGSFGIVNLYDGKLKDWKMYDVYDADGQLKGYVEPPLPIRDHLGEASWYLRDANWDPDFPTSAKRISWFLNKEMSLNPDIIMAFDVTALERLFAAVGPINIPEFPQPLTHENIYHVLQTEVEQNFFPGSHRKKDLLTLVAQSLMAKFSHLDQSAFPNLAQAIADNVNQKNLLIASLNPDIQQSLNTLNWSGGFPQVLGAASNQFADQLAFIEANLGVNKANGYITRQVSHQISFSGTSIDHTLQLSYTNSSTTEDKLQGTYKNYLRIYVPPSAEFRQAALITEASSTQSPEIQLIEQYDQTSEHGYQVIGLLAPIPPRTTATVKLTYRLPLGDTTEVSQLKYNFRLFKQPGTAADPYNLQILASDHVQLQLFQDTSAKSATTSSLTGQTHFTYNTNLSTDKSLSVDLAPLY